MEALPEGTAYRPYEAPVLVKHAPLPTVVAGLVSPNGDDDDADDSDIIQTD